MGFACEDDEFVRFDIVFLEGSNVNFVVPGVAFTEPFEIQASSDEFVDALTGTVMAKRKVLRTSLGNACIMAKQARRNTTSVTEAAIEEGLADTVWTRRRGGSYVSGERRWEKNAEDTDIRDSKIISDRPIACKEWPIVVPLFASLILDTSGRLTRGQSGYVQ